MLSRKELDRLEVIRRVVSKRLRRNDYSFNVRHPDLLRRFACSFPLYIFPFGLIISVFLKSSIRSLSPVYRRRAPVYLANARI